MSQKHFNRSKYLPHKNLVDKWLPRAENADHAIKIVTHETLHEVVNGNLRISNTAFTEALFDFLCGREETGLWFAKECFEQISEALQ